MLVAAVLVAGALGAVARWLTSRALASRVPWGVLLVNVGGSALAGAVAAVAPPDISLIVVTGFCGGLTTFSTFTVEAVQLVLDGRWRPAVLSIALTLGLGLGAAAAAYLLASAQA
jgi:fluoride exporter